MKKPILLYRYEQGKFAYYIAWDNNCERVLITTSFDIASRVLDDLGYVQVSPNSRIGTDIRQRLIKRLLIP